MRFCGTKTRDIGVGAPEVWACVLLSRSVPAKSELCGALGAFSDKEAQSALFGVSAPDSGRGASRLIDVSFLHQLGRNIKIESTNLKSTIILRFPCNTSGWLN